MLRRNKLVGGFEVDARTESMLISVEGIGEPRPRKLFENSYT